MKDGRLEVGDKVAAYIDNETSVVGRVKRTMHGMEYSILVEQDDGTAEWFKADDIVPCAIVTEDPDNVAQFREIVKKMADTYAKKNAAYGSSFSETYELLGNRAALVPIHNKFKRLMTLVLNEDIDNYGESIKDTLLDLACYSIMYLMEIENGRR